MRRYVEQQRNFISRPHKELPGCWLNSNNASRAGKKVELITEKLDTSFSPLQAIRWNESKNWKYSQWPEFQKDSY